MSRKHWTMQIFLRRLGVFILCVGLVAACLIYWSADEASRVTGYSIVGGQAYASIDMASKSDRYEVQRYGGTSAVIVHNFNNWLFSLWHGKRLAFTLGVMAILLAYACFWIANELDEQSNDQPPG
ncbi:MAG: hypothetical protein JWQ10_1807 [Herbaspirillum sp.]|nr:hypothetical protein [Herbaspirillum sp.]